VISLFFMQASDIRKRSVLRALATIRVASTSQNFTLLRVAAYSSSSGTGFQDWSGLNRSIFINSLKLDNPKSFS
jgi:hypothetical protein